MSTLVHPPLRQAPSTIVEPAAPADGITEPSWFTTRETHRWLFLLVIPFVACAAFFGLAIGINEPWPMAPAFVLGALPLILGYVYLALTADSNSE